MTTSSNVPALCSDGPGRYPDPEGDCTIYFICRHDAATDEWEIVTCECTDGLAYDQSIEVSLIQTGLCSEEEPKIIQSKRQLKKVYTLYRR